MNKAATGVTLRHRPTGLAVTVQDSRSQRRNRWLARDRLLKAIEADQRRRIQEDRSRRERARRRASKRPVAVKRRLLESKRRRSQTKERRRKPPLE